MEPQEICLIFGVLIVSFFLIYYFLVFLINTIKRRKQEKKLYEKILIKNLELKKKEDDRKQEELRKAELKKFEELQKRDEKRKAEQKRKRELEAKKADELRKIEEQRILEEQRQLEEKRKLEIAKQIELKRKEEERKAQELRESEELREIEYEKKRNDIIDSFVEIIYELSLVFGNYIFLRKINKYQNAYYLFDYISNYNLPVFPEKIYLDIRNNVIFPFKEGRSKLFLAQHIAVSIYHLDETILFNKDYYLCVIPSSNRNTNNLRFKNFVHELSTILGINNGFDIIERIHDREKSVSTSGKSEVDVLYGVRINNKMKGKKIILIDDVITKGASLKSFNDELYKLGADSVLNVFIGKTFFSNTIYDKKEMFNFNERNYVALMEKYY